MKVFLAGLVLSASFFAGPVTLAQDSNMSPAKIDEPIEGAIVKPTKQQLKTIPTPADKTVIETKKVEVETATSAPLANSNDSHLFGLHADVNFPHVLNYGVDYWHSSRRFSGAINLGGYSQKGVAKTSTDEGMDLAISNQEIDLKYHPFLSSMYVGAIFGQHKLVGKKTATYTVGADSINTTITDTITASYVTPHIGFMWKADCGLTFGMDLGWLFPINPKATIDEGDIKNDSRYPLLATQADYIENKRKLQEESDKYGKTSLPYLALVRVGWLF